MKDKTPEAVLEIWGDGLIRCLSCEATLTPIPHNKINTGHPDNINKVS